MSRLGEAAADYAARRARMEFTAARTKAITGLIGLRQQYAADPDYTTVKQRWTDDAAKTVDDPAGLIPGEPERLLYYDSLHEPLMQEARNFSRQAFLVRRPAARWPPGPDHSAGAQEMQPRQPTERSAEAPAAPAGATFPDTWRQDLAAGDKAFLKTLDRFDSPASLAKAYRELTTKLSSGELRAVMLANHPGFNKALLEVARIVDPRGSLLPNASGASLSNVESRIAEIEGKYMRAAHGSDQWKTYWTGESGARMQQEYRGLVAAREQTRR